MVFLFFFTDLSHLGSLGDVGSLSVAIGKIYLLQELEGAGTRRIRRAPAKSQENSKGTCEKTSGKGLEFIGICKINI